MWTPKDEQQQQAAVGEISGAANKEERSRLEENKLRHKILEPVFNPRVLLRRLDVQQMLLVKEDPPKDSNPHSLKEEVGTSLQGEKDEESTMFSQFFQPKKEDRCVPNEEGGAAEFTRNQDNEDLSNSSGTECLTAAINGAAV
ncbi:hypothetical protein CRENBAI_000763 [Crenichthys baileyi]|uniref:Uncharacterized protein n=1 Tax=Crenichthys baileyi TaxID=28760 RepID=A0AAV9RT17_9TELE